MNINHLSINNSSPSIKIITLITVLLIMFSVLPISDTRAETNRLTIIHSSNLNGNLLPCPT
jgi:hypothetical protein